MGSGSRATGEHPQHSGRISLAYVSLLLAL